jgi:multicomponent Na+:H+ antiporter subunit C
MTLPLLEIALTIFVLFSVGTFLVLEKHLLSILFGVAILSNAANLFLLAMSDNPEAHKTPFVFNAETATLVDPLPQALILTAIVIGSGVLMYFLFLILRLHREHKSLRTDVIFPTQKDES